MKLFPRWHIMRLDVHVKLSKFEFDPDQHLKDKNFAYKPFSLIWQGGMELGHLL
jgi:hypothetical protein